ncbi:hypothetical protein QOZ80_4BG0360630 [Eleusine coracana subsp. coracana]|nr:hypothetical protein QOZ80_4BG0360630 [Eleusine coracana subsp. coracana]
METIFGNSMATGNYAKDSSSALGTEGAAHEDEVDATTIPCTPDETGASSSAATRPNKRSRTTENDETEGLITAFSCGSNRLATAIEKLAGNMELPADLLVKVQELPGFDDTHKSYYYSHLVENPHVGRAFYNAPFEYKLNFIAKWISEKFPG